MSMATSDLRVLYLTRPYEKYGSATYQRAFIKYIQRYCNADIAIIPIDYTDSGNENHINELKDTICKRAAKVDFLITGHHWLGDAPYGNILPRGFEFLRDIPKPKIGIINKEYARLETKIGYFNENNFDLLISHHSDLDAQLRSKKLFNTIPIHQCLFGLDSEVWAGPPQKHGNERKYDLFFSGTLLNSIWFCPDQALRVTIEKQLFYNIGRIRLKPKRDRIFWNASSSSKYINIINRAIRLPETEYRLKMLDSRVILSTLSMGLITPRFFECLATGSVPLINNSPLFAPVIESLDYCVPFDPSLEDFQSRLDRAIALSNISTTSAQNYQMALDLHTWDKRFEKLINFISSYNGISF